ncbi:TRAP transporter substrate-binding protein [Pseudorhodoplanes sp.]|uniref:TRAP transporter substrate-binding protein n=1 Tax=Pseudorhodoplanes sp. TaxID=1934341 RepID=UPI003919B6B0
MSRMTRAAAFGSAAFAVAALTAFSPAAHAQTTLTMSSWVSPQHLLTKDVLAGWAQNVEKATNGRVKFNMLAKHPSSPAGTFDAVRDGLVDVSYVTASYTPARHVLPLLPELPGSGATAEINSVAFSRIHWKYFQPIGEYKGVKLLGVFTHGPGQMFNTKRPITKVEDLSGMKIRSGGGISEQMARALGASAFVKPAPESYELLSSGVADGTFFPLESIISFKLDTVVKHATLFPGGFYGSAFGFFMNEDKWNKLSKEDQAAIESVSGEALARLAGKAWDNTDRAALEVMKKANIQITEASPELIKGVQDRAKDIIANWKKAASAKGVDAEKVYAEFHEELKRVAAGQ